MCALSSHFYYSPAAQEGWSSVLLQCEAAALQLSEEVCSVQQRTPLADLLPQAAGREPAPLAEKVRELTASCLRALSNKITLLLTHLQSLCVP